MKTISIAEFEKLVARADWERAQEYEIIDKVEFKIDDWGERRLAEDDSGTIVNHVMGMASLTSTLNSIKITYQEGFNYDQFEPDSLTSSTEGMNDVWFVEGVKVIDDDGDELNAHDLADYLPDDFNTIDYSAFNTLTINYAADIDVDESADMETRTLKINNAPDIRFTGELIGSAASSDNKALVSSYSGQTGRWTELYLYKTKGGKYICHQIGRTSWVEEKDRFSGSVCETLEEVRAFFGHRWLAKELYDEAGIEDVTDVE